MVYCAAYGCTNVHTEGCGKSFFNFPKDARRRKIWTIFCKRESFVPTTNHRLCSDHFTKNQLQLERLGYEGARTRLNVDAVPDVPLPIHAKENNGAVQLVLPAKPRGAYAKRQKAEIFRQAFQELEPRPSENNTLPDHSIDIIEPGDPNDEHPIEPTASTNAIPETQSKKCQATLQVPQRTRRIQVSLDKKNMVSTSTQCSSLTDNIPLREAAGLTPVLQQHAVENVEDNDDDSDIEGGDIEGSDEGPDFDLDSEYPESDSSDEEDEEFQLSTDITPEEERQFLVSEVQLAKLLQNCRVCGSACHTVVNGVRGTMISTSSVCPNGHSSTWESQRCHHGMPWANLLVAGAIVFSGANASKSLRLFRHLNLQMMSMSTFSRLQASYVVPASIFTWCYIRNVYMLGSICCLCLAH
uniref:THAP-type domain-containing protein n=1 Tax=Magallana gigas TaxID=29159 RepID=A0A8W8MGE8_MAGGI